MAIPLNPYALNSVQFLVFMGVLIAGAYVSLLLIRQWLRSGRPTSVDFAPADEPLDEYETAFLAGGSSRVWLLAVARLVGAGRLHLRDEATLEFQGVMNPAAHPIELVLAGAQPGDVRAARNLLEGPCETIRSTLAAQGLLVRPEAVRLYEGVAKAVTVLIMVVGGGRLAQGIYHGKPVIFLVIGLVIALFIGALIARFVPFRTRAGDEKLASLKAQFPTPTWDPSRVSSAARTEVPSLNTNQFTDWATPALAPAIALWGLPALAGHPAYDQVQQSMRSVVGSSNAGSACSSSSCSSASSCGGDSGGGGGGCGGCGGGD